MTIVFQQLTNARRHYLKQINFIMKLSNALLSALLLGIAVETSSCNKTDEKTAIPSEQKEKDDTLPNEHSNSPYDCPACGMG